MSSRKSGKTSPLVLAVVLVIIAVIVLVWSFTHVFHKASTNTPIPMPGKVNMHPGGVQKAH